MLAVARDSDRSLYILPASAECAPRTGRADHVAGQTDEDVLGQFRCGTTVALPAVIDVEIEVIDPGYTDAEIMSESAGTTRRRSNRPQRRSWLHTWTARSERPAQFWTDDA